MYKYLAFVGIIFLLFSACSETVETRLQLEYPFSVFGIINPKADTHAVRIFEIKQNIALVRPDPIDAIVTTTQIQSGEVYTWRDSVVQLEDGDYRHVYWSEFKASMGEDVPLKSHTLRWSGNRSHYHCPAPGESHGSGTGYPEARSGNHATVH